MKDQGFCFRYIRFPANMTLNDYLYILLIISLNMGSFVHAFHVFLADWTCQKISVVVPNSVSAGRVCPNENENGRDRELGLPPTHPATHSLTYPPDTHSLTNSPTHSLSQLLTHFLIHLLADWLADWLTHSFTRGQPATHFTHSPSQALTHSASQSSIHSSIPLAIQ